jgi:hypothetical protein
MSDTPRFNSESVRTRKVPRYYVLAGVGRAQEALELAAPLAQISETNPARCIRVQRKTSFKPAQVASVTGYTGTSGLAASRYAGLLERMQYRAISRDKDKSSIARQIY